MDKKLLSILCCPVTHRELMPARRDLLAALNAGIREGQVRNREGEPLADELKEALVTADNKLAYPVRDGIPVLLEGEGIGLEQVEGQ